MRARREASAVRQQVAVRLDPVALLAEMRKAQTELGQRVARRAGTAAAAAAPEQSDTAIFVRRLGEHWRKGERRAIHRRPYVRRKAVTARPSMFDPHIPSIEEWLATAPYLSAVTYSSALGSTRPTGLAKGSCVRCNGWSRSGERKQLTSSSPALKARSGSSRRLSPHSSKLAVAEGGAAAGVPLRRHRPWSSAHAKELSGIVPKGREADRG
jgi:hypothetical protein